MSKKQTNGVYQLTNGHWAYRFTKTIDGKSYNRKGTKDIEGNPLKTKRAATKARELAMLKFDASFAEETNKKAPDNRVTVKDVYDEYCEKGRSGKAYGTIRKQESLWENHIKDAFGERYIDDISVAEVNDYLSNLYYTEGRAYGYVQGFLKMFYLIFGQAYSRNYLDIDKYTKLCVTKDYRISMPKMKIDEDVEVVSYDENQIKILAEYFAGTKAETAFILGCYCGLRINECYGLKWENVDLENGTLLIDRQMQYQDGLIKLVSVKTRNAKRTIYMSRKVKEHFMLLDEQRRIDSKDYKEQRAQNKTVITDLDGSKLSSLELVNILPNGKIQTVNSMKYHSRKIKDNLQIDFKYHHLRHTYGTRLAELNTPAHLLCNQMGHSSSKVTEKYYIAISKKGVELLHKNLDLI